MGFLDKLFAKKICDICGGEIGLLGNKKLEDGNCCKDCAKKLSPWFDERRHSTIEQIKAQLAYREQNEKELEGFSADVVLGDYYKMFIELKDGVPHRFVVSGANDFRANNSDIILFKNVYSCDLKIRDSRTEQKYTNEKNERVSYNPPRYEYHYDFYIELGIANTPWFDDISLRINRSTLNLETVSRGNGIFIKDFDPMLYPEYREMKAMCDEIVNIVNKGQNAQNFRASFDIPEEIAETERQIAFGEKVREETDPRKQLALYEEEYARVKDNPALAERAAFIDKQRTALQYACMTPGEQAAKMTELMQQKQKELMQESGLPDATVAAVTDTWKCESCGSENTGKFCVGCGAPKPTPATASTSGWKCFCGTVNGGKFCQSCGTPKFAPEDIECSNCSWTADTWHEDVGIPATCPNCGKDFNSDDIA